jgi:transaldolase
MVQDVAAAADLLKPIYLASKGADGHASIEVSPTLAHDTKGTVEAAQRIWKKLSRPNIMIKIPATPEGLPAIREVLREGINVNVTLIFSVEVYQQVAEAHISALEARAAEGLAVTNIDSVASFFVSRVDAMVEKSFAALVKAGKAQESAQKSFFGKVGIANSRLAYAKFEELYRSPRFAALEAKGARVQRPLWASTGTKNPSLSPVLYIEELAGRQTVNTLPPPTLQALLKGATIEPRLHSGVKEARALIDSLAGLGLNFQDLLVQLQKEGVASFADSYRDLIASIESKRGAIAQ